MDNLECKYFEGVVRQVLTCSIGAQGYTVKFGMQYVNLTTQERSFKSSFFTTVKRRPHQRGFVTLNSDEAF